jgi:acyl-CoA thioester hydrolase
MKLEIPVRPSSEVLVRFQDCDPLGHLNNSKYIHYIMNAREDHLVEFYNKNLYSLTKDSGVAWVVGETNIRYIYPAIANEKIRIETAIIAFDKKTVLKEGVIYDFDKRHIKSVCWIHFSFVNLNGKSISHSDSLLNFLNEVKDPSINQEDLNFENRVNFLRKKVKEEKRSVTAK